jgi:hypothetical protein
MTPVINLTSQGTAKDLILAAGFKECDAAKAGTFTDEFLEQPEQSGKISQRSDSDRVNITLSKLSGEASTFVKGLNQTELRGITYEGLKQKLVERFGETSPLQYSYPLLHEAKQEKEEGSEQFLDRCSVTLEDS